jgi:DNA ligase-associated metallophosphoesterase
MIVDWAGGTWELLGERALWWAQARAIVVADLHLGKSAAFRAAGVPVPELTTRADLTRLHAVIQRHDARRVLILGDLLHAKAGRAPAVMQAFATFRHMVAHVEMDLVRGNHDEASGDPPREWGIECHDEPWRPAWAESVVCVHHPPEQAIEEYMLCGHMHPCHVVEGPARSTLRSACFWFTMRQRLLMLPAFGSFTGHAPIAVERGDRVVMIGPMGELVDALSPARRATVR